MRSYMDDALNLKMTHTFLQRLEPDDTLVSSMLQASPESACGAVDLDAHVVQVVLHSPEVIPGGAVRTGGVFAPAAHSVLRAGLVVPHLSGGVVEAHVFKGHVGHGVVVVRHTELPLGTQGGLKQVRESLVAHAGLPEGVLGGHMVALAVQLESCQRGHGSAQGVSSHVQRAAWPEAQGLQVAQDGRLQAAPAMQEAALHTAGRALVVIVDF